jgi:phosphoribosylanthranilate isomerase
MFIKICGIRSSKELEMVERFADATGVVVECESKRKIGLEDAKELIAQAKIPVFVVSTLTNLEDWLRVVDKTDAKYVQIHSDVNPDVVEGLKDIGLFVMKAFKVPRTSINPERDARALMERIEKFKADMILLDTGKGSGLTHDHRVSKIIAEQYDVVLAGGLNPKNVAEIVKFVKPFGVDVSSGVERNGSKDEDLIAEFVKEVKRVGNHTTSREIRRR